MPEPRPGEKQSKLMSSVREDVRETQDGGRQRPAVRGCDGHIGPKRNRVYVS